MHRKVCFVGIVILATCTAAAQRQNYIFNPGVRIGYSIGAINGLYGGIDLSLTTYGQDARFAAGAYVSLESNKETSVAHFGLEFFYTYVGVAIGPAIITKDDRRTWGWSTTLFGGLIVLPYYQILFPGSYENAHEYGVFLKLPVPLQKQQQFSLGG